MKIFYPKRPPLRLSGIRGKFTKAFEWVRGLYRNMYHTSKPRYLGFRFFHKKQTGDAYGVAIRLKRFMQRKTFRLMDTPALQTSSRPDAGNFIAAKSIIYNISGKSFAMRYEHRLAGRTLSKIGRRLFGNAIKHWMY